VGKHKTVATAGLSENIGKKDDYQGRTCSLTKMHNRMKRWGASSLGCIPGPKTRREEKGTSCVSERGGKNLRGNDIGDVRLTPKRESHRENPRRGEKVLSSEKKKVKRRKIREESRS